MPAHKLLLYPADPDYRPDPVALLAHLQEIGLAGDSFLVREDTRYLAGEHFLQHISFLGCSPAIEFEPPADPVARETAAEQGGFCHIGLSRSGSRPAFRGNRLTPPPRCPSCRKAAGGWRQALAAWRQSAGADTWQCSRCGYSGRIHELDFRRHGGFACLFIDVWGIHPSEAVPVDGLLASLAEFSGGGWNYMYVMD